MADAISLMRRCGCCPNAAAAAAGPPAAEQKKKKQQPRQLQQEEEEEGQLARYQKTHFKNGFPRVVFHHESRGAAAGANGKAAAEEEARELAVSSSTAAAAARRRLFGRPLSVSMLLQLFIVCFSLLPPSSSLDLLPPPVLGISWAAAAAAPSTVLPLLPLLLSPAAAAASKTTPAESIPSTTEKASAAVKNRWGVWWQRLNAAENAPSPKDGLSGASAGRLAAAKAEKNRGASPSSKSKEEKFFYSVPLQLAGSTLLLGGGSSSATPAQAAPPADEQAAKKTRKGLTAEAALPAGPAVLFSQNTPFPAATQDRAAAAAEAKAAGAISGSHLSAWRAAPAAGAVPTTSRRIPLSLRAHGASAAAAGQAAEAPEPFAAGGVGVREAPQAAGGAALRPQTSHLRLEALQQEGLDPTRAAPAWPPSQGSSLPYGVNSASAERAAAASAAGVPGFAVTHYGGGGGAAAAAAVDAGEKEQIPSFHRSVVRQQQQESARSPQQVMRQQQTAYGPADVVKESQANAGERQAHPAALMEPVLLLGHMLEPPPQQAVDSSVLHGLRFEDHQRVAADREKNEVPSEESHVEIWTAPAASQQQYVRPSPGQRFDFAEWRRRLQQQQRRAPGASTERQQETGGVVVVGAGPTAQQQEAEELFGRGTKVQLLKSRRDFEMFVRREVVQNERVAVVLFFGRHCPYCMMFKGLFSEAAETVPVALGNGSSTIFAAKEAVLYEDDFTDDEDDKGEGQGDARRTSPEPVETMLGVTHIPQIRVIAPLHRAKQRPAATAVGRRRRDAEAAAGGGAHAGGEGAAGDRGRVAAALAAEEAELEEAAERGAPQIYWLPPLRPHSEARLGLGVEAGSRPAAAAAAAAAPYWTARLGHADFSPDGIYKFLVENTVVDSPKPPEVIVAGVSAAAAASSSSSGLRDSPYAKSTARQSHFRPNLLAPERSPLTLVEKVLHAIIEECRDSGSSGLQAESTRHKELCSGSARWGAAEERETSLALRLHDALSTLVYILKRWVPMSGKGDRLSREAEAVLQRFLEICRYVFPWKQAKKALFSLQVVLQAKGSGAEPVYWQWRKPGFVLGGGTAGAEEDAETAARQLQQQQQGEAQQEGGSAARWGWWHASLESTTEKAAQKAAAEARAGGGGRRGSKAGSGGSSLGDGRETARAAASAQQIGELPLPKAAWVAAVKSLQLVGIGGAATAAAPWKRGRQLQEPRLLQCENLLCGVWTLFHILAEGAAATFRARVRQAAEQAAAREEDSARRRGRRATSGDRRRDTADIVFYGPQDNVGAFATRRYMELLRQREGSSKNSPLHRHADGSSGGRGSKSRAKAGNVEEDVSFMIEALQEQLGALGNAKQLQAFEEKLQHLQSRLVFPAALVQHTLRDFVELFFSCYSCRTHFLQCYNRGFFGARDVVYPDSLAAGAAAAYRHKLQLVLEANDAAAAEAQGQPAAGVSAVVLPAAVWRPPPRKGGLGLTAAEAHREKKNFLHLRLWLWRLHNAVNIRTASEATRGLAAQHPGLFLSKEELLQMNPPPSPSTVSEAERSRVSRDEKLRDYSPLHEKSLGVGYYVGVDPRWPLRSTCPVCRLGGRASQARGRGDGFVLTGEYLLQNEKEEDICIHSDFYADFDLKEVKRFLSRTYWGTDHHLFQCKHDANLAFNYDKLTFSPCKA